MPVEIAIVLIVAIIAVSRIYRERYRAQGRDSHDLLPPGFKSSMIAPTGDPALEREVADLRKRLEVLERIATEDRKTRELADEIDRLR